MRWSERQQGLLQAMGLTLWIPPGAEALALPAAQAVAPPDVAAPATAAPALQAPSPAPAVGRPTPVADAPPVRLAGAEPRTDRALPPGPGAITVPFTARDTAVSRMEWPELADTVAACQACGLCATRRHTVFGVGHPRAQLMVVGEAPGEQEDRQGEPFVGAAGQLLDRMLQALGLTRGDADAARQVYIANTLKCRPPGNRNPSADELAQCVPYLERQVALVQPRVILAMGRFAVQALLGSDAPLGRLRGQVHRWQGVPLVVSYHPAYLLRQPADKGRAWADLCLAASLLG